MKSVKVSATHTETLYPSLPGAVIEVKYKFDATVMSDSEGHEIGIEIDNLSASVNDADFEGVSCPSDVSTEGHRFLAPLREAARRAAYKLQLAADARKAAQEREQHPREYRNAHAQNFPSFRPVTPDNDDE